MIKFSKEAMLKLQIMVSIFLALKCVSIKVCTWFFRRKTIAHLI